MTDPSGARDLPEGIFSLLDTDLYKLTMQCAILKYLPDIQVTYAFTNRTPDLRLNRAAYHWLQEQVNKLANIVLAAKELDFLHNSCPYFSASYLRFLQSYRFKPSAHVKVYFKPLTDTNSLEDVGDIHLDIGGLWLETILYEIPLLALTSEAYFRFCDRDWNYEGQEEKAYKKAIRLLEHGCTFSEFGTRRRRDRRTQEMVMHGLMRAAKDADEKGWPGKLTGTSNVRFAMECDLPPIGTVAHEWFMGIASITNDYEHANETALRYWVGCFGEGVLGIALTDTFGTPTFLKSFKKSLPVIDESDKESVTALRPEAPPPVVSSPNGVTDLKPGNPKASYHTANKVEPPSYAKLFNGVRQDSGDPLEYIKTMRGFYDEQGITEKKTIVFSDSLNVGLCLEYKPAAEKAGFNATFGIGTNLTNDFMRASDKNKKSLPPNIVIKISSASGRPAIKISDNIGKNTGDAETVHKVKETLGYVEKQWADGDEKTRYVEKKEQPLA